MGNLMTKFNMWAAQGFQLMSTPNRPPNVPDGAIWTPGTPGRWSHEGRFWNQQGQRINEDGTLYITRHLDNVIETVQIIFNILLGLGLVVAIVFAVFVGFRLASAEDEGKRKEAKKQLLWTIVAIFAIALLILILNILVGILRTDNW